MNACDRCHRRKSKCDKQVPFCGPCVKAGVECVYTDRSKEPTYRREVVERLERRLRQCEATNRALAARLATAQASSSNGNNSDDGPKAIPAAMQTSDRPHGQAIRHDGGNEVTDEVSYLSLSAGGERQFLGSASGVLFANLVRATIDVPSLASPTVGAMTPGKFESSTATAFRGSSAFPLSPLPPIHSIPKADSSHLLPEAFARDLHHAYFEHDHLCYPFLHRPTVLAAFEQIYRDPTYLERDVSAFFVFYMILAISSVDFHKYDWQTRPDAEKFHGIALSRLNEMLQVGGLMALQAILLLCQYRMRSSVRDTSGSLWHLVGVAARMCFELGLHRESLYQTRGDQEINPDRLIAAEVRRRCFFCVLAIDRVVSLTLGRPLAIRLDDFDVVLPNPQYDLDMNPPDSSFYRSSAETFSRTALFVHIVRYRILCGKILAALHSGIQTPHVPDEAAAVASRDRFASELDEWRQQTATLCLPAVDLSSAIPGDRSSFRAHEWYELLYHNAVLMLYRPSPALPGAGFKVPTPIQTIFSAAKQAITLYAHLHRSRRINYTWITLHAVFMAGLSYVYAVGRHFRAKRSGLNDRQGISMLSADPSIIEVVNETRACSNVLVAVSERWSGSRNTHEVFHRLSDAVLVDAIELLSNKSSDPATPVVGGSENSLPTTTGEHVNTPGLQTWSIPEILPKPQLAVDSVLRECFQELQHMHDNSHGDDPIGRLSQDWLGEIGGLALEAVQVWGE